MEFFRRATSHAGSAVLFPGAYNPPTRAHFALAFSALDWAPEVIFVLPRRLPHKAFERPLFEDRLELLLRAATSEPRFSVAATGQGLFVDIARAARNTDPALRRLLVLCGRDAAERIVNWDYGRPGEIQRQLEEYELLVAPRPGPYDPPPELRDRVHALPVEGLEDISSSEIRERIRRGQPCGDLVPEEIAERVCELYRG